MNINAEEFDAFLDELIELVRDKFKYWRTYTATVKLNADAIDRKGQVALECLELLAKDQASYIWAKPVGAQRNYVPPKVGDLVILFFKDTDPDQPRFIADLNDDYIESMPMQNKATLVEMPTNGSKIEVDDLSGGFTVESKSPMGQSASPEKMALGEKMKDLFDYILDKYVNDLYEHVDTLYTMMASHTHTSPVGPTSSCMPPVSSEAPVKKGLVATKKADIPAKKAGYSPPGQLLSPTNKCN